MRGRFEDFAPAVRLGAVDVIHGDVYKWGGIGATKALAAHCETFGLGMNLHSGGELGPPPPRTSRSSPPPRC